MLCKHIMHILRYGEILIEQSLNFQNLPAKIIYHHYLTTLLIKGVNRAGFYECPQIFLLLFRALRIDRYSCQFLLYLLRREAIQ